MSYIIFLLVTVILLVPSIAYSSSPGASVMVSFVKGMYDPLIISAVGGRIVEEFKGMEMLYAVVPSDSLEMLSGNPAVQFVEMDGQFEEDVADATTNENTTSSEYSQSWALEDIGLDSIHSSNFTGRGVKVAVLDTGIDYRHPELAPSYKGGYDFINSDNDPMDDNGHGTHVAGILAAARDGRGIVGVAPDAEIYSVKISDRNGKGSFSGLVEGINWAIENKLDVVTMSITGEGGSKALEKAVKTAYEYNIVLVAAVGNGKGDVLFPAAYDQVIGVGSIDVNNTLSTFSLTGKEVELVAPGSGIKSTAMGGGYRIMSGTSMATPFVTGAAALLLGSDEKAWVKTGMVDGDGRWTNDEVRKVLRGTAKDLGEKGKDNLFGYGLLNLSDFPGDIQMSLQPPLNTEAAPTNPPATAAPTNPAATITHISPAETAAQSPSVAPKLGWFPFRIILQLAI